MYYLFLNQIAGVGEVLVGQVLADGVVKVEVVVAALEQQQLLHTNVVEIVVLDYSLKLSYDMTDFALAA
jgi:ribosomal protein L18E